MVGFLSGPVLRRENPPRQRTWQSEGGLVWPLPDFLSVTYELLRWPASGLRSGAFARLCREHEQFGQVKRIYRPEFGWLRVRH
jgi:hypothetical protein